MAKQALLHDTRSDKVYVGSTTVDLVMSVPFVRLDIAARKAYIKDDLVVSLAADYTDYDDIVRTLCADVRSALCRNYHFDLYFSDK